MLASVPSRRVTVLAFEGPVEGRFGLVAHRQRNLAVVQRPELFLALAAVMAWAALVPSRNLFDAIYNYTVAHRRGVPPLRVAPAPRRFSQGSAAAMSLAIGVALLTGATSMAWILEGAALVSTASVLGRRFCVPAHLYYVLWRALSRTSGVPVGMRLCSEPSPADSDPRQM